MLTINFLNTDTQDNNDVRIKAGDIVMLNKNDTHRTYLAVEGTKNGSRANTGYDIVFVNLSNNKVYSTKNQFVDDHDSSIVEVLADYFKANVDNIDYIIDSESVEINLNIK